MESQATGWCISAGDDTDTADKSKPRRVKKRSFIKALESKYSQLADVEQLKYCKIVFHGKPKSDEKSELGFLRNVVLTDSNIAVSGLTDRSLRDVCPHVVDLDISGNLFDNWKSVLTIVSQLDSLKYLNVSRNPLKLGKKSLEEWTGVLPSIENLVLNRTDIPWTDVLKLTEIFQNLKELHICGNGYSEIPDGEHSGMYSVETLRLNDNKLENWEQIWKLKHLPRLKSLILSGNPLQDVYFHDYGLDTQRNEQGQTDTLSEQTKCDINVSQQSEHGNHGDSENDTTGLDLEHGQGRLKEGSELYEECRNILELLIYDIHDNQIDSVQGNIHAGKGDSQKQNENCCEGQDSQSNVNAQIKICDKVSDCDSVDSAKGNDKQVENQNTSEAEMMAKGNKEEKDLNTSMTCVEVLDEEKDLDKSNIPKDETYKFIGDTGQSAQTKSNATNQNEIQIEDMKENNRTSVTSEDTGTDSSNICGHIDIDSDIVSEIQNNGRNHDSSQLSNETNKPENENSSTHPVKGIIDDNTDVNEGDQAEYSGQDNQNILPFQNLENICLSDTKIGKWKHLTALSAFPALVSIRIKDVKLGARLTQEDRRKLFVPCLPKIKVLNGSEVTTTEREKGERYFLRYFCDKPKKPQIYSKLEKKHGTLTPLVDVDISRGYQEFVTLTFVFEGQEVFKETVSVRQPVGKLRLIIAENLSLYASLKNIQIYHKYCNPEHRSDLLYTGELEQLVLDTLPMSRFDIMDGDEIHIDLYDKFTLGAYKYIYVRNYLPKKKELLDELKTSK